MLKINTFIKYPQLAIQFSNPMKIQVTNHLKLIFKNNFFFRSKKFGWTFTVRIFLSTKFWFVPGRFSTRKDLVKAVNIIEVIILELFFKLSHYYLRVWVNLSFFKCFSAKTLLQCSAGRFDNVSSNATFRGTSQSSDRCSTTQRSSLRTTFQLSCRATQKQRCSGIKLFIIIIIVFNHIFSKNKYCF